MTAAPMVELHGLTASTNGRMMGMADVEVGPLPRCALHPGLAFATQWNCTPRQGEMLLAGFVFAQLQAESVT